MFNIFALIGYLNFLLILIALRAATGMSTVYILYCVQYSIVLVIFSCVVLLPHTSLYSLYSSTIHLPMIYREDAGPRRFRITPLHIAVLRNQYDAVCALIDLFDGRIDVNCQDAQGDTPLHMASRYVIALCVEIVPYHVG